MTLEQIKIKIELMKAKVDLIKLEQEYAPYINQKEIKEMKKEIDEKLKDINTEEKYEYKVGIFNSYTSIREFINDGSKQGYIVDKFSNGLDNLSILMKKRRENE